MKFKVGDRVRFIGTDDIPDPNQGVIDSVTKSSRLYPYVCSFGGDPNWPIKEEELVLNKEYNVKKILDKIDGQLHKS